MITQKEINNACEHLKIVATVSDDLIEFIREASYQKLMSEENGIDKDVEMLNKKFGIKAMSEIAQKCIGTGIGIDGGCAWSTAQQLLFVVRVYTTRGCHHKRHLFPISYDRTCRANPRPREYLGLQMPILRTALRRMCERGT